MNKELIIIGATVLKLTLTTTTSSSSAQNATTDASNAVGNMTWSYGIEVDADYYNK